MVHENDDSALTTHIPDSVWNIRDGAADIGEHPSFEELANAIAKVTSAARNMAARHVLDDQLWAYWNSGRMIEANERRALGAPSDETAGLERSARKQTCPQENGL